MNRLAPVCCPHYNTLQQEEDNSVSSHKPHFGICFHMGSKLTGLFTKPSHKLFENRVRSVCVKITCCRAFASLFPNLCDVRLHMAGCSERQRRGSFSHQRGQEPGVRPADGLVSVATHHLSSAQHLQPHGDVLGLVPPQGQPLHPLPRFLPL